MSKLCYFNALDQLTWRNFQMICIRKCVSIIFYIYHKKLFKIKVSFICRFIDGRYNRKIHICKFKKTHKKLFKIKVSFICRFIYRRYNRKIHICKFKKTYSMSSN